MSDVATPEPTRKTEQDFDFVNAATFRDLSRIAVGNVQEIKRNGPRKVGDQTIQASQGDRLITIAPNEQVRFAKDDFERRFEPDPDDRQFYRSRATGNAVWVREPIIFVAADGSETPVEAGGAIFKSDVDGAVETYQSKEFAADFARLLKNGQLVKLSVNRLAQTQAIMLADDTDHLKDIGGHLANRGKEIGSAAMDVAGEVIQTIGTAAGDLARDAGKRLLARAEANNPDLVKKSREAVTEIRQAGQQLAEGAQKVATRARGWLDKIRGGGDPPGTKPGN